MEKEKRKILLVEDEADMLSFLSTLMDAHGFEPVPARSKSEGLQKAREEKPSCIILDGMIWEEEGLAL